MVGSISQAHCTAVNGSSGHTAGERVQTFISY